MDPWLPGFRRCLKGHVVPVYQHRAAGVAQKLLDLGAAVVGDEAGLFGGVAGKSVAQHVALGIADGDRIAAAMGRQKLSPFATRTSQIN